MLKESQNEQNQVAVETVSRKRKAVGRVGLFYDQ